jgi:hypothetical protein
MEGESLGQHLLSQMVKEVGSLFCSAGCKWCVPDPLRVAPLVFYWVFKRNATFATKKSWQLPVIALKIV